MTKQEYNNKMKRIQAIKNAKRRALRWKELLCKYHKQRIRTFKTLFALAMRCNVAVITARQGQVFTELDSEWIAEQQQRMASLTTRRDTPLIYDYAPSVRVPNEGA